MEKRILVVDDEEEIRELIVMSIEGLGLSIVEAPNGQEALKLIQESPFHLVVSDLNMPIKGGISLLEDVRKFDSNLPFIFLTGFTDKESLGAAATLGAAGFIEKPFQQKEIVQAVKKTLDLEKS